jgi:asparagine synthase (glutamine-hydrolysing)
MAREASQPVKTFSVGFEGDTDNELPYARAVAKRYGTDHHEFLLDARVVDALPLLVQHHGEPFADSSAVPTYFVTRMARQQLTVALSGDGGDESFSGYDRYGELLMWEHFDRLPASFRRKLFDSCAKILCKAPYGLWSSRMTRGCRMAAASLPERYRIYTSIFKDEELDEVYSPKFKALLRRAERDGAAMLWDERMSSLDWMMKHDQRYYLPDCLMVKTDVSSMANSLELRSPFLDHKVIELAARIPSSAKRHGMNGKIILKEAVQALLPQEVLDKPKTGFGVPLAHWFRNELRDMLYGTLLDDRAMRRGLFNSAFVRRMVDEQVSSHRDWSTRLWALMCLELWFREFVD